MELVELSRDDIQALIVNTVKDQISSIDINQLIKNTVENVVSTATNYYNNLGVYSEESIAASVTNEFHSQTQQFIIGLSNQIKTTVLNDMYAKINSVDVLELVRQHSFTVINELIRNGNISENFLNSVVDRSIDRVIARLPEGIIDTEQVDYDQIVELVVKYCNNRVRSDIQTAVSSSIQSINIVDQIQSMIESTVTKHIDRYQWPGLNSTQYHDHNVVNGVVSEFQKQTTSFLTKLQNDVQSMVINDVVSQISSFNVHELIREQSYNIISNIIRNSRFAFPDRSIPARSINTIDLTITADNITQGIYKNFESTGIQDRATECQLTIIDENIVVENKLIAKSLTVSQDLEIGGNVNVAFVDRVASATLNKLHQQFDESMFDEYTKRVLVNLSTTGIDPGHIRIAGEPLVDNVSINKNITHSNLKKLGLLQDLTVAGETLLFDTVYVGNKRLGLNTIDPENVFDFWDQEVQITGGKRSRDTSFIGTPRNQTLILSTNNRDQLRLNPDGSVTISDLTVGRIGQSSSQEQPTMTKPVGYIMWNEDPRIGSPIGWVSLGGARWARFGTITE